MQATSENKRSTQRIYKKSPSASAGDIFPRYKWTVDRYYKLGDLGFFDGKRVELIRGEIHEMAPMKTPHAASVQLVAGILREVFGPTFSVRQQLPLALSAKNEPEPDVAVVKGKIRDFIESHPSRADLVVEVSDSTLFFDRSAKAALYAEFGIDEYWIVNVAERQLEVYRIPSKRSMKVYYYAEQTIYTEAQSVAPLARPKSKVKVSDFLP